MNEKSREQETESRPDEANAEEQVKAVSGCCEFCDDGGGNCIFPYYGLAPHKHEYRQITINDKLIDGYANISLNKNEWPENFKEDKQCQGMGTYTHCLKCGAKD